jgi:hypothetical protein
MHTHTERDRFREIGREIQRERKRESLIQLGEKSE